MKPVDDKHPAREPVRMATATKTPWRLLLDTLPQDAFLKDTAFRFVAVNRALCRSVDRAESAILGQTDFDLYPTEVAERHRADDRLVLETGKPLEREEQRLVQGRPRTLQVYRAPAVDESGALAGVVGLTWDVTARSALDTQVKQAERLEAVARLAGGVAHDFNNLLTVVNGFSEILLGNLSADDEQRELVEQIKQAGERAADLTRRLLAFSRQQVTRPRLVDLNQLLTNSEKLLRRLAGDGVELVLSLAPGLAPLFLDPGQLDQVLQNLVANARDAMPTGGRLHLQTRALDLDDAQATRLGRLQPGRYLVLTVSDTGLGMDGWVRERLFEPFFTTKEFGKGTGLGLSIVHGIIRQNGGHIDVDSERGRGTACTIYLPAFEGTGPTPSAPPAWPRGSETVLVAEDEEIVRNLARCLLAQAGYTVVAAGGADALAAAARHPNPIHLLLSDVLMPQVSGPELARRLRADRPGLKVLYLSGYTDRALSGSDPQQAGLDFLQKPFTPGALLRKVREVLDT